MSDCSTTGVVVIMFRVHKIMLGICRMRMNRDWSGPSGQWPLRYTRLTVEARISWGQHPMRKLLHTFPSENLTVFLFSPGRQRQGGNERICSHLYLYGGGTPKYKIHLLLTIACCAHQLIQHGPHLIGGRHRAQELDLRMQGFHEESNSKIYSRSRNDFPFTNNNNNNSISKLSYFWQ